MSDLWVQGRVLPLQQPDKWPTPAQPAGVELTCPGGCLPVHSLLSDAHGLWVSDDTKILPPASESSLLGFRAILAFLNGLISMGHM